MTGRGGGWAGDDEYRRGREDGFSGKKRPRRCGFNYHMGYDDGAAMREAKTAEKAPRDGAGE